MSSSESTILSSSSSRPLAGIPTRTTNLLSTLGSATSGPTSFDGIPTYTDVPNGNNNGGGGSVNSTLYLFTFLTTLLLLLAVSCGIVIRSFILRRRFHRRVEEAIAAGVLLPSQTGDIAMGPGGSINISRRNIGEKPKMWEAWIDERTVGHHPSLASDWTKVQPFAVTRLTDAPPDPKVESPGNTPSAPPPPASVFQRLTTRLPLRRSRAPTTATPATPEVALPSLAYGASPAAGNRTLDTPKDAKPGDLPDSTDSVQVAVFIAMPDPSRPRYIPGSSPSPIESHADGESSGTKGKQRSSELPSASTEEHELPEICFGIAQTHVAEPTAPSEQHNSVKPA